MFKRREIYKIDNTAELVGKRSSFSDDYDWYKWKVFVNESEEKLKEIVTVVYKLHESFPNRIQVARNRDDKFAISAEGWGEFKIQITFNLTDGSNLKTDYYLKLASKVS